MPSKVKDGTPPCELWYNAFGMDLKNGRWRITHVRETVSTNVLARDGRPGDVFTADFQSAGRGRLDHRWLSPPGENLMMSAVVDVSGMEPQDAATLPLAVGLAIAEALAPFAGELRLKWPNDVLAGGRKLAGVLCERNGDSAIVGVGVNVRQTSFAPEIADRATSLALLGADMTPVAARDAVLASLGRVVGEWRRGGFAALLPRVAALDCLKGGVVSVRQSDGAAPSVRGVCSGIARDGSLVVAGEHVWAGEAHVEHC